MQTSSPSAGASETLAKPLGLCGMCHQCEVTPKDDANGHMLFTTDGDVWDLCGVCVADADTSTDGCAFCLGAAPYDSNQRRLTAAISLYRADMVVGVCDDCFPYDLGNSDTDDGDDDGDDIGGGANRWDPDQCDES